MAADTIRPAAGWLSHAACTAPGADPDAWHPDAGDERGIAAAKRACGACPVRELCLADALATEDGIGATGRYGISGGLTPAERYTLSTGRRVRPSRARCGTESGYSRHIRRGEPVDEACQAAHRAAGSAYYHQAKARAVQAEAVAS